MEMLPIAKNNLLEIIKKANVFMDDQNEVWDRDELKGKIEDIIADRGEFVCLLGGKSTGKTLVIRYLEKVSLENKLSMGNVFVVNLRAEGSDILTGLIAVLRERRKYYVDLESEGKLDVLKAVSGFAASFFAHGKQYEAFDKLMSTLVDNNKFKQPLKVLINELLKRVEGSITLVIDEANIAFTMTPGTEESEVKALKGILAIFTQLTKETRKV
jgi:hypothetical protein